MNVSKVLADNLMRTTEEKQRQSYGEFCLHHKLIFMSVQQLAQHALMMPGERHTSSWSKNCPAAQERNLSPWRFVIPTNNMNVLEAFTETRCTQGRETAVKQHGAMPAVQTDFMSAQRLAWHDLMMPDEGHMNS